METFSPEDIPTAKITRKPWGKETLLVNTELYAGKIITCEGSKWSSDGKFHYHRKKDETFYILEGTLELDLIRRGKEKDEMESFLLRRGEIKRIYPADKHRFRSSSPSCRLLAVSTMDDERDSIRVGTS